MLRAVLDSSVLVSAYLSPSGTPAILLVRAGRGEFRCCISEEILAETAGALLKPKHQKRQRFTAQDVSRFCAAVLGTAEMVLEVPSVRVVERDPKDDIIVACALHAGAGYLVTGDNDLLDLGSHAGIAIVTPRRFLEILDGNLPGRTPP